VGVFSEHSVQLKVYNDDKLMQTISITHSTD